jgi:hypothetical protein
MTVLLREIKKETSHIMRLDNLAVMDQAVGFGSFRKAEKCLAKSMSSRLYIGGDTEITSDEIQATLVKVVLFLVSSLYRTQTKLTSQKIIMTK